MSKFISYKQWLNEELSAAEALYGFGGWLTSRDEPITISTSNNASIIAELIDTFIKKQKLAEPKEHWKDELVSMNESPSITELTTNIKDKIERSKKLSKEMKDKTNIISEGITPKLNLHMTHAEDLVLLGGEEGLDWVVNMFKELYEKLKSDTDPNKIRLSVKFDGAPSVFVWSQFPGMEKAGLAIKALFAKDPKLMFNEKQVDHYYGEQPDLAFKLKFMLKYIPSLKIPKGQIWQGDFLFDKTTLTTDKEHYSFHPNTIVYKVDKDSEIGKRIASADIGVVWHTRYTGKSLSEISAKYNIKTEELKQNPKVFMVDPYIASLAGIVTLTKEEKNEFEEDIYKIERLAKNLNKDTEYKSIIKDNILIEIFMVFENSLIKTNIKVEDAEDYLNKFIEYINKKYKTEMLTKKTEKSQVAVEQKRKELVDKIEKHKDIFQTTLALILQITELKQMFIKKLNNIGEFETYLETNSGRFLTTGEEGFAVSDIHGNVVKLIDRYEFSFANFSPKIIKGWTKK